MFDSEQYQGKQSPWIHEMSTKRGRKVVQPLLEIIQGKGYVAGSFAAWMATYEEHYKPGDIDVFAVSLAAADDIRNELCRLWEMPFSRNEMVTSHDPSPKTPDGMLAIQVVEPHPSWTTYPDDILNSFDLTLCKAVLLNRETVLAHIEAGCPNGRFVAINSPMKAMKRMLKYHKRGVSFEDWELLKILKAWDAMTPEQKQMLIDFHEPANENDEPMGYEFDEYFFRE